MKLDKIYTSKSLLYDYPENVFVRLNINIGISNPVLFLANKRQLELANYFNLDIVEALNYDINIISFNSFILMYIINIKAPYFNIINNGVIIRNRIKWYEDMDAKGISVSYTFEDFHVVSNANKSCEIFCKSIVSDQKT